MQSQRVLLFASLLGMATTLPAQLAGTYVVGPSGNFANISAAIAALTTQGVVAPVTFMVTANDTGPWTIGAFPGQGPANPVSFDAVGPITIAGSQPVLTLGGCASVTFRGFSGTFTNTPNAFLIAAGTSDCVFTGCNFLANVATSGAALFNVTGGSGLRIEDSTFGGAYEAIYATTGCTGTRIERCNILGGGFWIMRIAGADTVIENNFITGTSQYGISAGISGTGNAGTGANLKIRHNSVFITHPTTGAQFCSLRWYTNSATTEVVNNVFVDNYGATGALNMWCSGALRPALMNYNCLWSNIAGYNAVFAGVNNTFAMWQALGYDLNSISADPLFVAPTATPADLSLQPGSPCTAAGTFLPAVLFDHFGSPRTAPVSIGGHELDGMASYAVFGPGCTGTAGVPTNTASQPPQLGTSSTITFGNLPSPELAIAVLGFSNTTSGFGPLPLDMAAFGAPNCFARVSPDATIFLLGASGSASLQVTTPNLPPMIGVAYHTQGLVLDPTLNALGVSMSAAATAVVGL